MAEDADKGEGAPLLQEKKLWFQLDVQDVVPQTAHGIFVTGCVLVTIFILLLLFIPYTVTQLGQLKYGLVRNRVLGTVNMVDVHYPGRHWIGFWQDIIEFPSFLQTIDFSEEDVEAGVRVLNSLQSRDIGGKWMRLDVTIQYLLKPAELGALYREMQVHYEDVFISELRDALAKACNLFRAEQFWEEYTYVLGVLKTECDQVLARRHADCWGLQLGGIQMNPGFETALARTQQVKQSQRTQQYSKLVAEVRSATMVQLAEYSKNITVMRAGGNAEAYAITQHAINLASANVTKAVNLSCAIATENLRPNPDWPPPSKAQVRLYMELLMLRYHGLAQMVFVARDHIEAADYLEESVNVAYARHIVESRESLFHAPVKAQFVQREPQTPIWPMYGVDGCYTSLATLEPVPLDSGDTAAVRCCSEEGDMCESEAIGCLQDKTFEEADAACAAQGMRLCTKAELDVGVCCNSGCQFDGFIVWSGSTTIRQSTRSFWAADGCSTSLASPDTTALAEHQTSAVRCCAQVIDPEVQSCFTRTVGCLESRTYRQAEADCAAAGHRLCTLAELETGVCCDTGCQFDAVLVWTSTLSTFREKYYMGIDGCDSSLATLNSIALREDDLAAVRCCSMAGTTCVTEELGCLEEQTYDQAVAACSSINRRLCTHGELEGGVCCSTGCSFDGFIVWSSTQTTADFGMTWLAEEDGSHSLLPLRKLLATVAASAIATSRA